MKTIEDQEQNDEAIYQLIHFDQDLGKAYGQVGLPEFWNRDAGFSGLLQLILEQQVSLASAKAVFEKLTIINGYITPNKFVELKDNDLRLAGFSRQKITYSRILAGELLNGNLDLEHIAKLSDKAVKDRLMRLNGIGSWTVDCYLIFCLNRADVWPAGDLALNKALKVVKKLEMVPNKNQSNKIASAWKPWRSAAARLLWHYYLTYLNKVKAK